MGSEAVAYAAEMMGHVPNCLCRPCKAYRNNYRPNRDTPRTVEQIAASVLDATRRNGAHAHTDSFVREILDQIKNVYGSRDPYDTLLQYKSAQLLKVVLLHVIAEL